MADLEKQIQELQTKLDQATVDLDRTRAQLLHQEKLASLGQLTAGIAHEIKNPLNFVNNFAEVNVEMLEELRQARAAGKPLDDIIDALMVNAQRIGEHGRRASEIVRSMIQHDSAGSGLRERTNLNALVSEHLALSYKSRQAHIPDLGVKIKQDLSLRVGKIEVVPRDIGWVILNLVNNAIDALQEYAPTQPDDYVPTIAVSTTRDDRRIVIRVADNGPGIHATLKERVFEPFVTTKSASGGTGLGLSLSYEIITQGHGGTMTVESEEGKGATFEITLPDEKR